MDLHGTNDDRRLYIGNIDHRISEATLIRLFSQYGKIESEDFLLHTRGPKRGEPRGFAFIQFCTKEEARLAREKMHGRLACGRPLVVRLASEKSPGENITENMSVRATGDGNKQASSSGIGGSSSKHHMNRGAKIAAIKHKLRTLEPEECDGSKRQKKGSGIS